MGNEYNRFQHHHHHHHHHHQHHNLHMHHHRSTFLPMLCSRPSIKDVRLPNSSASFKEDPLSPRISCMGQVKRGNKVNGFPTSLNRLTITTTSKNNSPDNHHHVNNFKYSKLKKLFSGKNLTANATSTTAISTIRSTTTTTISTTRCRRQVMINAASGPRINGHHKSRSNEDHQNLRSENINLVDLDPPLPVIKRVYKKPEAQEEEVGSLWKRRSGRAALEGLQLKQIHLPRHQNQPTTV